MLPEMLRQTLFYVFSMTHLSMTSVYKFPAIKKLYDTKTSEGISLLSCIVDVYSQSIYLCYNLYRGYELMTFFDYVITDSTVIIYLWQVLFYHKNLGLFGLQSILGHLGSVALFYFAFSVPEIVSKIIFVSTICSMSGKILQIIEIYRIARLAKSKNDDSILNKLKNNSQASWLILMFTSSLKICIYLFLQTNPVDGKLFFHSFSGLFMNGLVYFMLRVYTPRGEVESKKDN